MNEPQTTPRIISWTGYLAIALLIVLPLSVFIVRSGAWQPGLMLYALACFGSVILLMLFIALMLLPRFSDCRAAIRKRALFTLPGTLALLSLTMGSGDYPRIHDITTDTEDPPQFVTAADMRGEGTNPLSIKPDFIEAQKVAYTDLQTLRAGDDADAAFDRAVQVAQQLGWEVYHQDRSAGIIEAVDTTVIMRFKDDIVIRVRGDDQGAYVDLRSVSRVGLGDLGANANRIRAFAEAYGKG